MSECKYIGCDDRAVGEEMCGPHYNAHLELERIKRAPRKLSQKEEKEASEMVRNIETEVIDEMINLDWWYEKYGENEMPAKFMNSEHLAVVNWNESEYGPIDKVIVECAKLSRFEVMYLNEKLKELEGTIVDGSHVWTFTGNKHYKRDGSQNHFACLPLPED